MKLALPTQIVFFSSNFIPEFMSKITKSENFTYFSKRPVIGQKIEEIIPHQATLQKSHRFYFPLSMFKINKSFYFFKDNKFLRFH